MTETANGERETKKEYEDLAREMQLDRAQRVERARRLIFRNDSGMAPVDLYNMRGGMCELWQA